MRYYLKKLISQHPCVLSLILCTINAILFGNIHIILGISLGVGTMVLGFFELMYVIDREDRPQMYKDTESYYDTFKKKIAEKWLGYEEKYKNNEKILIDIYKYKIENLHGEITNIQQIPNDMNELVKTNSINIDMGICQNWLLYLAQTPMELQNEANKSILRKMEQIQKNANKIKENHEWFEEDVLVNSVKTIYKDLKILQEEIRKSMGIQKEFDSVFKEIAEKHSLEYLIPALQSILENKSEFEQTLKKLTQIYKLLPSKKFPAKLRIVLEDMIVHAKNFEQSNDESYQKEVRDMTQKVNKYFDDILENETEMTVMEEIASVRALKEFVS